MHGSGSLTVEDACFRYVPDSSSFYNVPDDKFLNGLILGHAPGAVRAANWLHMAAALFGTTVVSSFFGLRMKKRDAVGKGVRLNGRPPPAAPKESQTRPGHVQSGLDGHSVASYSKTLTL